MVDPRYRLLLAVAAGCLVVGLLSLVPYEAASGAPRGIVVVPPKPPNPSPFDEWQDDRIPDLRLPETEWPYGWIDAWPVHPVTGRIMDPQFDCPGMPGPPVQWDEE